MEKKTPTTSIVIYTFTLNDKKSSFIRVFSGRYRPTHTYTKPQSGDRVLCSGLFQRYPWLLFRQSRGVTWQRANQQVEAHISHRGRRGKQHKWRSQMPRREVKNEAKRARSKSAIKSQGNLNHCCSAEFALSRSNLPSFQSKQIRRKTRRWA